ncbi:MAG: DedA family protein [Sphingomicrobium sp.]
MSDWIVRLIEQSGYLGIGFLMFLETVFPPIPSEVIMPIAGVAAGQGKLHFGYVVAAGTAGAMLGNIVWYLAARALGVERLRPFIARHGRWLTMDWAEVQRAERWFGRFGSFFVFLGRLLPTVRSLVSVPAGLLRMRFKSFFIASTIGTALWTAILAGAGFQLQQNVSDVAGIIGPLSNAILIILAGAYAWRLWRYQPPPAEREASKSD